MRRCVGDSHVVQPAHDPARRIALRTDPTLARASHKSLARNARSSSVFGLPACSGPGGVTLVPINVA